tara:strand:- start:41 stop:1447 length:1407 start_codon:yes stop_codon:yes gene_type:complete
MASTIKVNNIQNQCGANIANKCGSTVTLGASGDTVTLACGASQTGFGRTGTVDWDTTAKTASFTAESGDGYFVNTTSGAITITLPASPSSGDIVSVKDYAGTFATNNLTIARNGSNLDGSASDSVRNTDNESLTLVYVDGTQGWKSVEEGTGYVGERFMVATGGTITTCGDYKIHTFTGPGTFCVSQTATCSSNNTVDYLVVAGGGGSTGVVGSGGGAGGFRVSNATCMPAPLTSPLANPTGITVTATSFPIAVGGGGSSGGTNPTAPGGSNSSFSTITSAGGGGGRNGGNSSSGASGGSGSGGGGEATDSPTGGAGNTPPVSPPQGNSGGGGGAAPAGRGAGGGGGAACAGENGTGSGGDGGNGSFVVSAGFAGCNGQAGPVCGARYFSGGGGGGFEASGGHNGEGGLGGGGVAGPESGSTQGPGTAGTTNTGGGAGGASRGGPGTNLGQTGAAGGSGIVIIRYKYQ